MIIIYILSKRTIGPIQLLKNKKTWSTFLGPILPSPPGINFLSFVLIILSLYIFLIYLANP